MIIITWWEISICSFITTFSSFLFPSSWLEFYFWTLHYYYCPVETRFLYLFAICFTFTMIFCCFLFWDRSDISMSLSDSVSEYIHDISSSDEIYVFQNYFYFFWVWFFSCNDETDLGFTSFTNSMTLILVWFYFYTFLCHLLFENIPNL